MAEITNTTYDEIDIGDTATYTRTVTEADILAFARVSGDINPLHTDPDYAATTQFGERIAHGMLSGAFILSLIHI